MLSFVPFPSQILCKFTLPCCLAVYRCLGQFELPFRVLAAGHTFFVQCTELHPFHAATLSRRRRKLVLFAQTRWSIKYSGVSQLNTYICSIAHSIRFQWFLPAGHLAGRFIPFASDSIGPLSPRNYTDPGPPEDPSRKVPHQIC